MLWAGHAARPPEYYFHFVSVPLPQHMTPDTSYITAASVNFERLIWFAIRSKPSSKGIPIF